jgi:hypothetical protein
MLEMVTIFDVIDNFWGRSPLAKVARADKIALTRFGNEVNRFYKSYIPPQVGQEELRTYYGGLVAVNFSLAGKQTTFFNNLLYAHSTIIPDPLPRWYFDEYEELSKTPKVKYCSGRASVDQSEWIGWILNSNRAFRWNLEVCREVIQYFISGLLKIRPLVEAGIIVLVSQAHVMLANSKSVVSQALNDASNDDFKAAMVEVDEKIPLWDTCRGGAMTPEVDGQKADPDLVRWATAKEAAYYIHKNLAIAASAEGQYIPENSTDFALLNAALAASVNRVASPGWKFEIARTVKDLCVPSLEGLDLENLISIRKNASAFEEFRNWLARRLMHVGTDIQNSIIELTSEELTTELNQLREKLRTSNVIKTHIKEDGLKVVVGALVTIASGAALGSVLAGTLAGALAGVATNLFKRDRVPANSVIAQLAQMNRTAQDATFGQTGKPLGLPRALSQPFLGEFGVGPNVNEVPQYTPSHLRSIVSQALEPNTTGNPYRAVRKR